MQPLGQLIVLSNSITHAVLYWFDEFMPFYQRISEANLKICFSRSCSPSWVTKQTYFGNFTCLQLHFGCPKLRGKEIIEEIIFWQNHWKFRFVTSPQKIPDKMKLHPSPFISFLGLWNFHILFRNSMSLVTTLPTSMVYFEIARSHSYTDSYISSFWWIVNITLQKFDTLPKKRNFDAESSILIFTVN